MQKSRPPLRFTSFLSAVNLPCDSVQADKRVVESTTALHDTRSLVHPGCIEYRGQTFDFLCLMIEVLVIGKIRLSCDSMIILSPRM